jgi:hypothetical protein
VWHDNQGRECAYGKVLDQESWMHVRGIGSFRFEPGGLAATVVPLADSTPEQVLDTYYRTVLPMALQFHGREVLHASAVVVPQGVLALCAVSETGKSTLAFALARRGYPLYADDAVVFELREGQPLSSRIPFKIRLRRPSADHFGTEPKERVLVGGGPAPEARQEQDLPLAAVFVLERSAPDERVTAGISSRGDPGAIVAVERLAAAVAFQAVLPHAYCFSLRDPRRKALMMRQYMGLADKVPVLRVRFRPGLEHLPAIVDEIARAVAANWAPAEAAAAYT